MIPLPSLVLAVIFAALSGLHVFWVLSDRLGGTGLVPSFDGHPVMRPGTAGTLIVAVLLATAAAVTLWRGGWPDSGPAWVPRTGIWVIAAVFAVRAVGDFRFVGFFKSVRGTVFARNDTLFFSPLCLAVSLLAAWLAVFY